jgi:hypothetical protein
MSAHATPLQRVRALPARPLLLWMLAMLLVLKAAVPLLASASAMQRGVALAEVCSVYGVRVGMPHEHADAQSDAPAPKGSDHASGEHCTLTPVLGSGLLAASAIAAVLLRVPADVRTVQLVDVPPLPDASRGWLADRAHAPPFSV